MSFDLRKLLDSKQEYECSRRDEFAFRLRARTIRLLIDGLNADGPSPRLDRMRFINMIATAREDDEILAAIAAAPGMERLRDGDLIHRYLVAHTEAYTQIRDERGDFGSPGASSRETGPP